MKHKLRQILRKLAAGLSWRKVFPIILGAAICSFGIYNIHQQTGITEGGRDYEVTVAFDTAGTKKMFAAFAKLQKIDE